MSTINDGGPAQYQTLRDDFAKAAMTGLVANPSIWDGSTDARHNANMAARAYMLADAMLAARESKP